MKLRRPHEELILGFTVNCFETFGSLQLRLVTYSRARAGLLKCIGVCCVTDTNVSGSRTHTSVPVTVVSIKSVGFGTFLAQPTLPGRTRGDEGSRTKATAVPTIVHRGNCAAVRAASRCAET
jgi:hypothetical protein